MKVALVLAAFREHEAGRLALDDSVVVVNSFASAHGHERFSIDSDADSDPEPWARMGQPVALRWLAYRALVRSSNLATNLLLGAVGLSATAAALEAVGASDSVVARGIEDTAARASGRHNLVTARDLARTLQALTIGAAASRESCDEVVAVLSAQQVNDAIPAGLPAGTAVAHKSGWVEGVSHDAAIIYPPDADPFILVICTTSTLGEQAALDLIADGASAAWADRHEPRSGQG